MTIGEGLKKALYFSVGAIAVGVEAIADAADSLTEKGEEVVTKGKAMVKDAIAKRKSAQNADADIVIEADDIAGGDPVEA